MLGPDFNQEFEDKSTRAKLSAWFAGLSKYPIARWLLFAVGGLAAACVLLPATLYLAVISTKPDIPLGADFYALNRPQAFTFLNEKGAVMGRRGAIVGERLKLADMPPYLPAAFLAMEDRRFFQHRGVDMRGMLRAALANIASLQIAQGGSTITQQLSKILFLTPERTLSRKVQEIADALALEKNLSKQQILELYLNRIYLGSGAYGVDGAAHVYFGKSARNVTVAEAAMLAALTRAPTAFSPRRDLGAAQVRADRVLNAMVETGAATAELIADARLHPAEVTDLTEDNARNYFLDFAADEAKRVAGGAVGDLVVVVTLDPAMQDAARKAISAVLDKQGVKAKAGQGALIAMSPDGAIRALIGGRDYAESPFNRATQAHRQPGSAFKVFVYAAALEAGLTPDSERDDEPVQIGNWAPENYGGEQWGRLTLTQAFAHSVNSIAVKLGQEVGVQTIIAVARRLGITSPLEANATLALGTSDVSPLELTAAYANFASLGVRPQPYTVLEVRAGNGDVLYRRLKAQPERVMSEEEALAMNAMLYEVIQSGTGRGAAVGGREVAGKTGTTQDYRDAWFIGFSPDLVAGVWVGNDDFSPMKGVSGSGLPAQIWSRFMRVALKTYPARELPRGEPGTYVAEATDEEAGILASQEELTEARRQRREAARHGLFEWLFDWGESAEDQRAVRRPERRAARPLPRDEEAEQEEQEEIVGPEGGPFEAPQPPEPPPPPPRLDEDGGR